MIKNRDRSKWFGASDTSIIMGNWETKTFSLWWLEKCGIIKRDFTNIAMRTGSIYEHRILDVIGVICRDTQYKIRKYRLRVNLDGNTKNTIYEVKTHQNEKAFKLSKPYWQQAQVQMFATGKRRLKVVVYGLLEADYINFFSEIDTDRIEFVPVEYDENFIKNEYLPRLKTLAKCLKKGMFPRKEMIV